MVVPEPDCADTIDAVERKESSARAVRMVTAISAELEVQENVMVALFGLCKMDVLQVQRMYS